jgi:hypothetical protein
MPRISECPFHGVPCNRPECSIKHCDDAVKADREKREVEALRREERWDTLGLTDAELLRVIRAPRKRGKYDWQVLGLAVLNRPGTIGGSL